MPSGSLNDTMETTHPRVKRPVTKALTILMLSAMAATSSDVDEYQHFGTFMANKLQNYLLHTMNKAWHEIGHVIFPPT
jgi:hypothetical protein